MEKPLTLPELHQHALAASTAATGSPVHDAFYELLSTYQRASSPEQLREMATTCERRIAHCRLPLELVAAYDRLAGLARWRIERCASA